VLIVEVEKAYMHCPKCMIRSSLWRPERWPDCSAAPCLAEALAVHAKSPETVVQMQAVIGDHTKNLY
jgi:hypothetical protein